MSAPPPLPAKPKKKPNHERWVISYADLLTLLLAFFVVLYASSSRDKRKMAEEAASLLAAFHGTPKVVEQSPAEPSRGIMQHQPSPVPLPVQHPAPQEPHLSNALSHKLEAELLSLQQLRQILTTMLEPLIDQNKVSITAQPFTLTIQLDASVLFPNGQASLVPPAVAMLSQIAGGLAQLPKPFAIVVQGYTDNQPIATAQFPSNWSLSAERAVTVVSLFAAKGIDGTQLSAQGFGAFAPVADNATDAGRAKNRRVMIVIHAPGPNEP